MDNLIRLILTIGLIAASIAAVLASVRVILGYATGAEWYWAGVVAAYAGPLAFAAALHLFDRLRKGVDA